MRTKDLEIAMMDLKLTVNFILVFLYLQFTRAMSSERICRNQAIDCGEKKISFKETPIGRTLPAGCQNDTGCRDVQRCRSQQNCTSTAFLEMLLDDCSCQSKCQVKKLKGHGNCYFFDVVYECVDKCNSDSWIMPVIIASAVIVLVIIVIVIILIVRRCKKQRGVHSRSGLIGPEDLQRAFEVHQGGNEKVKNKNINMTEIQFINAEYAYQDASAPSSGPTEQVLFRNSQGSGERGSRRQCGVSDCCSGHEEQICKDGHVDHAIDGAQERPDSSEGNNRDSQRESTERNSDYVLLQDDGLKIYIRNEDGKLTIPRTKLNKNYNNVITAVSQNEESQAEVPAPTGDDCLGDYDNLMFGNCGEGGETETQTNSNAVPDDMNDLYDNVLYEGSHGEIVAASPQQDLAPEFPLQNNRNESECGHLQPEDYGDSYDNVEFNMSTSNQVGCDLEAGQCDLGDGFDYDNVDFHDGHGEVVEFIDRGMVILPSHSLPVIYEHDEGISLENDDYDDLQLGQRTTLKAPNMINSGASEVASDRLEHSHSESEPRIHRHSAGGFEGQRDFAGQDQHDLGMNSQGHSLQNQGPPYMENTLNKFVLDQELDYTPNQKGNLYDSLRQSSFQKPVDYGIKFPQQTVDNQPSSTSHSLSSIDADPRLDNSYLLNYTSPDSIQDLQRSNRLSGHDFYPDAQGHCTSDFSHDSIHQLNNDDNIFQSDEYY